MFASEALSSFSPFQLIFKRPARPYKSLISKDRHHSVDYPEYYNLLLVRAQMIGRLLLEWRTHKP